MFCPKCGVKNPENGMFCRSCGTDLNVVSKALTGKLQLGKPQMPVNKKGKPISWESAFSKLFGGLAFIGVTIALANSNMGRGWWFWMLIPALTMIGTGLAQVIQIKTSEKSNVDFAATGRELEPSEQKELPPSRTDYVAPVRDSTYKTGNLAPPSVTDNTTKHLEMDSEGETMTLPKSTH